MKKYTVCEHLVDLWDILRFLHTKRDLVIARGNQLSMLLPLMERLEAKIKQEMDTEMQQAEDLGSRIWSQRLRSQFEQDSRGAE
jgi:hypothetical protein